MVNLSISLGGLQTVDGAFDSAARSIAGAFNGGSNVQSPGDTVDFSSALAGLLSSKLNFLANEKVALVEDSLTKSTLSVLA